MWFNLYFPKIKDRYAAVSYNVNCIISIEKPYNIFGSIQNPKICTTSKIPKKFEFQNLESATSSDNIFRLLSQRSTLSPNNIDNDLTLFLENLKGIMGLKFHCNFIRLAKRLILRYSLQSLGRTDSTSNKKFLCFHTHLTKFFLSLLKSDMCHYKFSLLKLFTISGYLQVIFYLNCIQIK